jgi:gamma-glutamylcyclotransferase (GGCT)/AIG2-like uncharacterized protein YtfP
MKLVSTKLLLSFKMNNKSSNFPNKFFVYGTLRPDIKASYYSIIYHNKKFKLKCSRATIDRAKLFHYVDLGYPSIIFTENPNDVVHGYLVESDQPEEATKVFDDIEDFPDVYLRNEFEVHNLDENKKERAQVYYEKELNEKITDLNISYIEEDNMVHVKSGDYKDYFYRAKVQA